MNLAEQRDAPRSKWVGAGEKAMKEHFENARRRDVVSVFTDI